MNNEDSINKFPCCTHRTCCKSCSLSRGLKCIWYRFHGFNVFECNISGNAVTLNERKKWGGATAHVDTLYRPLALRGHVTNASFKQTLPKIDTARKNYLKPEIWEETQFKGDILQHMYSLGLKKQITIILFKVWPTDHFSKAKSYNFRFRKNDVTWPLSANGLFKTQTPKNGALFKGKTKTGYYFQWQHNIVWTDYLFLSSWVFKLLNFCGCNICTLSSKVHTENRSHLRRIMTFNCIRIKDKDPQILYWIG